MDFKLIQIFKNIILVCIASIGQNASASNCYKGFIDQCLINAVDDNNYLAAQRALKMGASPNAAARMWFSKTHIGCGPMISVLTMAVRNDNLAMVKLLITHKANPNGNDEYGSPLSAALLNKNIELARSLIEQANADVNYPCSIPALLTAAWDIIDPQAVELLLAHGANPLAPVRGWNNKTIFSIVKEQLGMWLPGGRDNKFLHSTERQRVETNCQTIIKLLEAQASIKLLQKE